MTAEPQAAEIEFPPRDRRRFFGAIALFLAWIAFLIGLAATDAHRPQERAGTVPDASAPAGG